MDYLQPLYNKRNKKEEEENTIFGKVPLTERYLVF